MQDLMYFPSILEFQICGYQINKTLKVEKLCYYALSNYLLDFLNQDILIFCYFKV
jgi:hypothetical protein